MFRSRKARWILIALLMLMGGCTNDKDVAENADRAEARARQRACAKARRRGARPRARSAGEKWQVPPGGIVVPISDLFSHDSGNPRVARSSVAVEPPAPSDFRATIAGDELGVVPQRPSAGPQKLHLVARDRCGEEAYLTLILETVPLRFAGSPTSDSFTAPIPLAREETFDRAQNVRPSDAPTAARPRRALIHQGRR